jgi:hypothetical protein
MEKYDFSNHKFRASSFGNLMVGALGLTEAQEKLIEDLELRKVTKKGLTEKQEALYLSLLNSEKELTDKQNDTLNDLSKKKDEVIGLTDKQQETLDDLIHKRDNFELSKGAKSYLRKLRREIKFGRRHELKSKYLEKGIELEEEAITFLSLYHGEYFTNNKDRVFDDFFQGEVDVLEGYDTKCAWSLNTLPDPEEPLDKIYEYQDRVYARLHNKDRWTTSSIILSMTDSALADVIYREGFRWDNNEIADWRKVELIMLNTYEEDTFVQRCASYDCIPNENSEMKHIEMFNSFVEVPTHERIVEKTIERDLEIEKQMIMVVKASRVYLQQIEDEMAKKEIKP